MASWFQRLTGSCFLNNVVKVAPKKVLRTSFPQPQSYFLWELKHEFSRGKCSNRWSHFFTLEDLPVNYSLFTKKPRRSILVIRHPHNMFASRIRKGFQTAHPAYPSNFGYQMERQVDLWKSYARSALEAKEGTAQTLILFDLFVADEGYRTELATSLGFSSGRIDISRVQDYGGGSSFTGLGGIADKAFVTGVLRRSELLDDSERKVFTPIERDSELSGLWQELWEWESNRIR